MYLIILLLCHLFVRHFGFSLSYSKNVPLSYRITLEKYKTRFSWISPLFRHFLICRVLEKCAVSSHRDLNRLSTSNSVSWISIQICNLGNTKCTKADSSRWFSFFSRQTWYLNIATRSQLKPKHVWCAEQAVYLFCQLTWK